MLRFPRGFVRAEEVYTNNENGRDEGRYPITGGNWHSGIHINFRSGAGINESLIYPLISGELLAYRISDNSAEVPRGNHSNNFILLRHFFIVQNGQTAERIPFFTLHTNFSPLANLQIREWRALPQGNLEHLPFYLTYRFKVTADTRSLHPFITPYKGIKLFKGSHCIYRVKDDNVNKYDCNFDNFNDPTVYIELSRNAIEKLDSQVRPKNSNVQLYTSALEQHIADNPDTYTEKLEDFKLPYNIKIRETAALSNPTEVGKFFKITIKKDESTAQSAWSGNVTSMEVMVWQKDMVARGRLADNASVFGGAETVAGRLVFNNNIQQVEERNVRRVLAADEEFELADPGNLSTANALRLLKPAQGATEPEYVQINSEQVQVKIDFALPYKNTLGRAATPEAPPVINTEILLGYAFHAPGYLNPHYDVALILGNNEGTNTIDFMRRQHGEIWRYFFSLGSELYYHCEESASLIPIKLVNAPVILSASEVVKTVGIYTELLYCGEPYFVLTRELEPRKTNMTPLNGFFRVLEKVSSAVFSRPPMDSFILRNYDWRMDNVRVGSRLGDNILIPLIRQSLGITDRRENSQIKSIKRSIICAHPLEWDAEQYLDGEELKGGVIPSYGLTSKEKQKHFKEVARAVDIWNRRDGTGLYGKRIQGLKGGNALTENNFWFAHPVYFLNHLDRAGLLDESFNPYANRVIARQSSIGSRKLRGRSVVVKDNPGFAPEFWQNSPAHEGATFKANGQAYAVPTGIFNQEYHSNRRGIYRHEGVDFRGRGRTWKEKKEKKDENIDFIGEKILSFIHGKVINCGWVDRGLGMILVVANEHGKGIYLLAHLSGFAQGITRHSSIEPGETVAYVGTSGDGRNEVAWDGSHLHLEYYDIEYKASKDKEATTSEYVKVIEPNTSNERLELQDALTIRGITNGRRNRRNPFDHEETPLL